MKTKKQVYFIKYLIIVTISLSQLGCILQQNSSQLGTRSTIKAFDEIEEQAPAPEIVETIEKESRPTNDIIVNNNYCVCLNQKSAMNNNCGSFCLSKKTTSPTLYLSTSPGPLTSTNPKLGSLSNWCSVEIDDGRNNPGCTLKLYDGSSTQNITITPNNNSIQVELTGVSNYINYVATITESASGSNAQTSSFHLRLINPSSSTTLEPQGPLKIMPVSRYSCIQRNLNSTDASIYDATIKLNFFFTINRKPDPVPPDNTEFVCFDQLKYGTTFDSLMFPRLEQEDYFFNVWNDNDIRFIDIDNNGKIEVQDYIETEMTQAGLTPGSSYFELLPQLNSPTATNPTNLGYYLKLFVNPTNAKLFCPGLNEYNSNDVLFNYLGDLLGIETEGIYIAIKEAEAFTSIDGSGQVVRQLAGQDQLILNETLLKKIWFYLNNGVHVTPNDETVADNTIYFYWPPDINYPHVKKSTQRIYTLKHASETTSDSSSSSSNTLKAADRKFGCIPKAHQVN
jgi:hypothetical protein